MGEEVERCASLWTQGIQHAKTKLLHKKELNSKQLALCVCGIKKIRWEGGKKGTKRGLYKKSFRFSHPFFQQKKDRIFCLCAQSRKTKKVKKKKCVKLKYGCCGYIEYSKKTSKASVFFSFHFCFPSSAASNLFRIDNKVVLSKKNTSCDMLRKKRGEGKIEVFCVLLFFFLLCAGAKRIIQF